MSFPDASALSVSQALAPRFWAKVDRGEPSACWPFRGALHPSGYGLFAVERKSRRAHRVAFALVKGRPIPPGLDVLHSCDNPPCCNPDHLRLGTDRENSHDRWERKPDSAPRGEANGNVKLTAEAAREIRRLRAEGATLQVIARRFAITKQCVSQIVTWRTWRDA